MTDPIPSTEHGPAAPDDFSALSYEQARDALIQTVAALEQGQPSLEESIALWERGNALAARCEELLAGARSRLDAAALDATGSALPESGSDATGD